MNYQKNKSRNKLKPGEIIIIIFCFLISVYMLYKFYLDLNQTVKKNEPPIATVIFKERTVDRHFEETLLWDRLFSGADIYSGDFVRTANLADVKIQFNDESTLLLDDNTLVQIFYDDNGVRVDVVDGRAIFTSTDNKMTVALGGNNIKTSKVSVATQSVFDTRFPVNGNVEFGVQHGASLISTWQESKYVLEGEAGNIVDDSIIDITNNDFTETPPLRNAKYNLGNQTAPVSLFKGDTHYYENLDDYWTAISARNTSSSTITQPPQVIKAVAPTPLPAAAPPVEKEPELPAEIILEPPLQTLPPPIPPPMLPEAKTLPLLPPVPFNPGVLYGE
jgi:hypothetical protein